MPATGLEIPQLLKFSCYKPMAFEKIKRFVQTSYDHNVTGTFTKEDNSDEDNEITIVTRNLMVSNSS